MGNIFNIREAKNICCYQEENDENMHNKIRNRNKRYFILTERDFLEIDRIYEKHELHNLTK